MTIHPFPQLDVIQRASQQERTIFDCYRLLYKKDLWQIVIKRINHLSNVQSHIVNNMIEEIIYELRLGRFWFSNSHKINDPLHTKNILVIESVVVILEHIYHIKSFDQSLPTKINPPFSTLQKLKTWNDINWCIKITFEKITCTEQFVKFVMAIMKGKINDYRFIQLVFHASNQQKHWHSYTYPRNKLMTILKTIFWESIAHNIQDIIGEFENNDVSHKVVFYKEELLVGINGAKLHASVLLNHINNELNQNGIHSFCNIQSNLRHISDKIYFQKFQLLYKRNDELVSNRKQQLRLIIPKQQMNQWVSQKGYGDLQKYIPLSRKSLLQFSAQRILRIYNEELISFANHYLFAANFNDIEKIVHLAESSFLKTIAFKYKTTSKQIALSMKQQQNGRMGLICIDRYGNSNFFVFIKMHHLKLHRKKVLLLISKK
ncbi:hypothetical protein [Oceanobacillus sp. 1P07AA]|uniref:hypothetical protein n=1 Tax=Oceanobacillus sp. 1P07AA TaxID=3132293 RepID=UPI0039A6B221